MSLLISWAGFKDFITTRSIPLQYVDTDGNYYLKGFDGLFEIDCILIKNMQMDETADFEANYKNLSSTNKSPNTPGKSFSVITNTFPALTGGTPTLILASNSNRKYAYISNALTATVTIQLGSSTGLTGNNRGLVLKSGDFFEIKGENLFTGDVYAFTTSSAVVLSVCEGTI